MRDTGFPVADAENDFLRARRRQVLSRLAAWLRREPDDINIRAEVRGGIGQQPVRQRAALVAATPCGVVEQLGKHAVDASGIPGVASPTRTGY